MTAGNRQNLTLAKLLALRAASAPDQVGYTFLGDDGSRQQFTYLELEQRAQRIAAEIRRFAKPGDRALLVYPPGLDFVAGFFGCVYAGVLGVPCNYPRPNRTMPRHATIAADCRPRVALSSSQALERLRLSSEAPDFESLHWIASDRLDIDDGARFQVHEPAADDVAFLQYTSGSTSEPKGVMVTHRCVLHNLEVIRQGFGIHSMGDDTDRVSVSWLPMYHDMGLVGGLLAPLYSSGRAIFMSPVSFLQRPLRWLQAISQYRGAVNGAPSFAYDLCVEKTKPEERTTLDLSCWQVAFCGAEPIRSETLAKFAEAFAPSGFNVEALYPCYGLAESSLMVAGPDGPSGYVVRRVDRSALLNHRIVCAEGRDDAAERVALVGCGRARCDMEVKVVDPATGEPCNAEGVGEIWVRGASVARGYWNRPELTAQVFRARLVGGNGAGYLRTGDLGFIKDGELFVTGRLKDVIIIRGQNHYPQDIEATVGDAHGALLTNSGAAFSIDTQRGERLVVVHELDRQQRDADIDEIIHAIRVTVAMEHEVDVHGIAIIRQASLPRTSSGKVRRNLCRQWFLEGELKLVAQWTRSDVPNAHGCFPVLNPGPPPLTARHMKRLAERIETGLLKWLHQEAGIPRDKLSRETPFAELGLDSLTAVELSHELEHWLGIELTPIVAWNHPTPADLSLFLAQEVAGFEDFPEEEAAKAQSEMFEKLLTEIESLSDAEAEATAGQLRRRG